jgi:hypothetical protein
LSGEVGPALAPWQGRMADTSTLRV